MNPKFLLLVSKFTKSTISTSGILFKITLEKTFLFEELADQAFYLLFTYPLKIFFQNFLTLQTGIEN